MYAVYVNDETSNYDSLTIKKYLTNIEIILFLIVKQVLKLIVILFMNVYTTVNMDYVYNIT